MVVTFDGTVPGEEGAPAPVGDARMGTGERGEEPRQGADLQKQIGLFVEMSTPFFKVSQTVSEEGWWRGTLLGGLPFLVCSGRT